MAAVVVVPSRAGRPVLAAAAAAAVLVLVLPAAVIRVSPRVHPVLPVLSRGSVPRLARRTSVLSSPAGRGAVSSWRAHADTGGGGVYPAALRVRVVWRLHLRVRGVRRGHVGVGVHRMAVACAGHVWHAGEGCVLVVHGVLLRHRGRDATCARGGGGGHGGGASGSACARGVCCATADGTAADGSRATAAAAARAAALVLVLVLVHPWNRNTVVA
mmetsp:Transcript_31147/g.78004  ORF Transcript_31147/g.78004 Transcript_31147/m.78004 type:complete len:215 (-) Transcript_31147:840-1484(-)